jgi:hypothetical protein
MGEENKIDNALKDIDGRMDILIDLQNSLRNEVI